MEFFGHTLYGPQNYIRDTIKDNYFEPVLKEEADKLIQQIKLNLSSHGKGQDIDAIKVIDCYIGRVNGFAYGSSIRFKKMKRKGVVKPVGPADMYRMPPTSYIEYGWFLHDPALALTSWHKTHPRHPQPASPNTLILDVVRKNNKYATLF